MGTPVTPDFNWYHAQGIRLGAKTPRCPFASVHSCPRYYQSLSLLGGAGFTGIEESEDRKLLEFWKSHPLWPTSKEQATSMSGGNEGFNAYYNFCPEISYNSFGLFSSFLARHVDEIDRDAAARRLSKEGASPGDPRWIWSDFRGEHYSECPLYSPLSHDWPALLGKAIPRESSGGLNVRFDVFISHSSEDKNEFVRPLAGKLTEMGLKVWYDEWELTLGDSLRQKIDAGLVSSDFGVVVISRSFIAKGWPQAELDGLLAQEMRGRKVILPVWHNITSEEVTRYSPILAGKLAAPTNEGVETVAMKIAEAVRRRGVIPLAE